VVVLEVTAGLCWVELVVGATGAELAQELKTSADTTIIAIQTHNSFFIGYTPVINLKLPLMIYTS